MAKFIINGPTKLTGEIAVLGAKNAAMKMIAASVLIKKKVVLNNVPDIADIQTIINILTKNKAEITRNGHSLTINTANLSENDPDPKLVEKMRGSIVLIGPYLTRFGKISLPKPGGCAIGSRSIDTHLEAFKKIGAEVSRNDSIFNLKLAKNLGGEITLNEASVTATENVIMSQVLADKTTVIKNAATEPQIKDLADFLISAGAKIEGAGTNTITITGVNSLHSTTYSVMPDPFETATFACMALATKSALKVTHCRPDQMYPFLDIIKKMGAKFTADENSIEIKDTFNLKPAQIVADIHPAFSTDMLSPMGLVMTQANGESKTTEKLFENRLGYLKELQKMGAKIEFLNNHEAKIFGPTILCGANIESLDLRAGATLILAGLIAQGETIINNAEIVDRGYEKIEERLAKLGAKIQRIK